VRAVRCRPSNTGGVDHLAVLLNDLPRDRRIVVVGENDEKENGLWPGRDGAERVAADLARLLGRKVEALLPPGDAKDPREFVAEAAAGSGESLDRPEIGRAFVSALRPTRPRRFELIDSGRFAGADYRPE
jgi:hypothetical protein